jgi:putative hydrolase of the HAD superfamily
MIKAVIFDLDNTLIDFWKMKHMCCDAAMSSMIDAGLKVNKKKALKLLFELYDKYGLEDPRIFQKFLKKTTKKIDTKILAHGVVAYRKVKFGCLEPYPHVHHILLKLKQKGVKLAIVSDAPKLKAWIRLASMRIGDFFDVVVAFEDTKNHKPSPLPFEAALKSLRVKPEQCLMVGDWPERDILGAKKLGMKTAFAKYGNPKIKHSGADYVITDVKKLLDIVK